MFFRRNRQLGESFGKKLGWVLNQPNVSVVVLCRFFQIYQTNDKSLQSKNNKRVCLNQLDSAQRSFENGSQTCIYTIITCNVML